MMFRYQANLWGKRNRVGAQPHKTQDKLQTELKAIIRHTHTHTHTQTHTHTILLEEYIERHLYNFGLPDTIDCP